MLASLRGHRWLLLPLLILVGLLASILLAEVSARVLALGGFLPPLQAASEPLTTLDARLLWRGMPQVQVTLEDPEFTARVEHNSLGFRDSEWTVELGPCWRVLVLGDSFAWGWGVEEEETFSHRLEGPLGTQGSCVEVLNFGVMGYGTSQEYMLWEEEGRRYRPDLVVVAFLFSDLAQSLNHMSRVPGIAELVREGRNLRLTGEAQVSLTPVDYLKGWLRQNSYIYFLATFVVKSNPTLRELLLGSAAANLIRPPHTAVIEAMNAGGDLTERWLTLVRNSVHRTGAQFLVLYVPFVEELDSSTTLGRDAAQWRERTAFSRWLAEAEYLDLTRAFQEASSQGEHLYYVVNGHWTAAGHRLAAEEIAGHIRRSGLLPEAPR